MNSMDNLQEVLENYLENKLITVLKLSGYKTHYHIISRMAEEIIEIVEDETMEYEVKVKIRGYKTHED